MEKKINKPKKKDIERFERAAKKLIDIVYEIQEYCPTAKGVISVRGGSLTLGFSKKPQEEVDLRKLETVSEDIDFGTAIDSIIF